MPSPPPSANSQPKPTDPLPQRPGTNLPQTQTSNPPRPEETTIIRSFANFGGLQRIRNPASSSSSMSGTGLGDTAGARPGNNSASSLGGPGNGLRPSYSPFGSRDPPPVAGESSFTRVSVEADSRCSQVYDWKHATRP